MTDTSPVRRPLTRHEASDAVSDLGWRYVLGALQTTVAVPSVRAGVEALGYAVHACADHADGSLRGDVRRDCVVLTLQCLDEAAVTPRELDLARRVSAALAEAGLAGLPAGASPEGRTVQLLEIAVDALDIPAVRPFWKAVMGYADEPGQAGPEDPLVDPLGQGPALWFQQMDAPRPQRNRIHLDVSVPHDEADRRVLAAVEAGGRVVSNERAPSFWVLADPEGNEVCVTTWQGRD